jgi:ribosome-binding protein aMBF1 (putative translation factor)
MWCNHVAKPSPFAGNPALVGLGAVIRAERQAQGLSQEALADKANMIVLIWVESREASTISPS